MEAAPEAQLGAAEQALTGGDAAACVRLAEPLLQNTASAEQARVLLAQAFKCLSDASEAAGDHALALQQFRRFHHLHVESLHLRLARGEAQSEDTLRDALTGLASREALDLRLPLMMQQALAANRGLCLVRIELDPLQPARLGLAASMSDAVLRELGALLRAHSRAKDLALRFAGQTLVLVLSDTELATARMVCERIRRAAQTHDWTPQHPELRVSLSLGLTSLRSGDNTAQLLARAEAGLVSARRDGRNCVRTGVLGV
jgi:diguanylate cyclase (GGDEF)-like protein